MTTVTQPLRDEHKELIPHIEALQSAADAVGEVPLEELRTRVAEAHDFLARHLLPHAQAEERALYPVVGKALGAPDATKTMSRDHVEVERLTAELGVLRQAIAAASPTGEQIKELRRVLYGLFTLVNVHFAKEEEVYLPILDARLSAEEARQMFASMEEAAGEAKAHAAAG